MSDLITKVHKEIFIFDSVETLQPASQKATY